MHARRDYLLDEPRPRHLRIERHSTSEYRTIAFVAGSVLCVVLLVSGIYLFREDRVRGTLVDTCKHGACENRPGGRRASAKEATPPTPPALQVDFYHSVPQQDDAVYALPPLEQDTLYKSVCMPVIRGEEEPLLTRTTRQFERLLDSVTRPANLEHAPALRSLYEQCVEPSEETELFDELLLAVTEFGPNDSLEDILGLFARYDIANPLSLSYELHPKHGLRAGALVPLVSQHQVQFSNDPNESLHEVLIRSHMLTFGVPETKEELDCFGEFEQLYVTLYWGKPMHNAGKKLIDYALHSDAIKEEMLTGAESIDGFADLMEERGFSLRRYFKAAGVGWPEEFLWVHSPNTLLDFTNVAYFTPHSAWRDYLLVILHSLRDPALQRRATEKQHYVYHSHYSGRWALPWDVPSQYEFVTSEDHCMGLVEAYLPHATNIAIERAIPEAGRVSDRVRELFEEARASVLQFLREDRYGLFGWTPPQLERKLERAQLIIFDEVDEVRESVSDPDLPDIAHTQHYLDTILELRRRTLQKAATLRWNPQIPDARLLYDQIATPENAFFVHQLNAVVFNLGLLHAFATEQVSDNQVRFMLAHELTHGLDATGLFYDDKGGLTLEMVLDGRVAASRLRWDVELEEHYRRASFKHRVDNDLQHSKHENFADAVAALSLVHAYQHDGKKVSEMLRDVVSLFCEPLASDRTEDVRHTFTSTHSLASVRTDALWSLARKEFKATPPQPRYS